MLKRLRRNLVHGLCFAFVAMLFLTTAWVDPVPRQAQAQGGAVVNVPASILFVDCPGVAEVTAVVQFGYIQLDGNFAVREATVNNGGLTYIDGIPSVVFEQLSIDWVGSDSVYRFIRPDGVYLDVLISAGNWYRDSQSGVIYQILGC